MTVKHVFKENDSKGEMIQCHCNHCGLKTNHSILLNYHDSWQEYEIGYPNYEDGYSIDGHDDYQIIKCNGCNTITFRKNRWCSEFQDEVDNDSYEELYPQSEKSRKQFSNMPFNLNTIYEETVVAFNSNNFILCAIGIRAMIEGICQDKRIEARTLQEKIAKCKENGLISQHQQDALHLLRFLGNSAAHELQKPTEIEINAAFDIIEHMIEDLYELPEKSKQIKTKERSHD